MSITVIVSRTPLRISFVGGGSDLSSFLDTQSGGVAGRGAVVSMTINKYVHVVVNKRFEPGIRVSYSETEIVGTTMELKHDLIRCAMDRVQYLPGPGIEIVTIADVPARGTGLGASSAVTVGALNALYTYRGVMRTPEELAREASLIEIAQLGKPIGRQDQYACAYGGLNYMEFGPPGYVGVKKLVLTEENFDRLGRSLLMFYTGQQRSAADVLEKIDTQDRETRLTLHHLGKLATRLADDLRRGDPDVLGEYLHEGWMTKRRLNGVSYGEVDEWYEKARKAGAEGGKLLGAGGGGFLLFHVLPEKQEAVRKAMKGLRELPVALDHQGSRIIHLG